MNIIIAAIPGGVERRLAIGFEVKHFTKEQLAKLAVMNPGIYKDMGLQDSDEDIKAEFLKTAKELTEVWRELDLATEENTKVMAAFIKAKKGDPLFAKGELLAALLFFVIIMLII